MLGIDGSAFYPLFAIVALIYLVLACLPAALTRRWWSGILLTPLPPLFFLGDETSFALFGVTALIFGLPVTVAAAVILRQMADSTSHRLGNGTREGAAAVGTAAGILALMIWRGL